MSLDTVMSIAQQLAAEGRQPSVALIKSRLPAPCPLRREAVARVVIRIDLGPGIALRTDGLGPGGQVGDGAKTGKAGQQKTATGDGHPSPKEHALMALP